MKKRLIAGLLGVLALGGLGWAGAHAQSGAGQAGPENPLAGLTGEDHPEDVIHARRLVMTMIGARANTVSLMGMPGAEYHRDLAEEALLTMGFLFSVFPHLFPPQTNTMPAEDSPGDLYITNARPDVWENFDDFYARSQAASEAAFAALAASPGDDFVAAVADLQAACDSCHADYRRTRSTYGIPIPPLD